MDLRDMIVWVGLAAICLIIWDGLRRMKAAKPKVTRKEPTTSNDDYVDPEEAKKKAEIARELPNGGARTREMTETEKKAITTRLNLRERVPMLMERVEVESPDDNESSTQSVDTSVLQSEMDFSLALAEPDVEENTQSDTTANESEDVGVMAADESQQTNSVDDDQDIDPSNDDSSDEAEQVEAVDADELDENVDLDRKGLLSEEESEFGPTDPVEVLGQGAEPTQEYVNQGTIDPGPVEDLVVIHVMAKKGEVLSGSSVLDLLITAGLRHGPMDIFHYRNPKGITEFSLANCVHPGTFDPDSMNQVNTPGVTLFMQLPTAADSMESFDHMYEMARFLANHIDAEILDEDHSTVTPQRIEYYREKLRSFERTRLIPS
jgi:cell division protein ZipA